MGISDKAGAGVRVGVVFKAEGRSCGGGGGGGACDGTFETSNPSKSMRVLTLLAELLPTGKREN